MTLRSVKLFIISKFIESDKDPIDASKNMISSIQKLVGIHNVFGDPDRHISFGSIFGMFLCAGAFIYVGTFSQSVYLINVFPDKVECFKAINCLSSTCIPMSKYIFMWTSSARLKKIFAMSQQGLNSVTDERARLKIVKTLQSGQYVSWLVVLNQAASHMIYLILPLLLTIIGNDKYLPTTPGEIYGFSSAKESPYFEIAFALIIVATAFSAINQTGYIVLFVTLLSHELGHIYAITETLNQIQKVMYDETIPKDEKNKSVDDKLRFCVKHHQFFMQYHAKIRKLYKIIFGCHFLLMTIVLVTTLQTLNAWNMSNTILTGVTGVLPLFVYCFGGELLFSAENEMSLAAYSCGWELMKVKQAKIVCFVLALSERPLYLTAADIFIMNRDTFGTVVQVVYKIYAVFN